MQTTSLCPRPCQGTVSMRPTTGAGVRRPPLPLNRTTCLELLVFHPGAEPSEEELRRAYRSLALRWHPDRPHNRGQSAAATEAFLAVKDAYDYSWRTAAKLLEVLKYWWHDTG